MPQFAPPVETRDRGGIVADVVVVRGGAVETVGGDTTDAGIDISKIRFMPDTGASAHCVDVATHFS